MRDLSAFETNAFDIVWHAHSINFVPELDPVFDEVERVLSRGGLCHLDFWNPYVHGVDTCWKGEGYLRRSGYSEGARLDWVEPYWDVDDGEGGARRIVGPHEFRHTLGAVFEGLIRRGFLLFGLWETVRGDPTAHTTEESPEPGSWGHFKTIAPPFLRTWWRLLPDEAWSTARRAQP
jgi:SAM-dependent methyltransferase